MSEALDNRVSIATQGALLWSWKETTTLFEIRKCFVQ